ncbi:MAG: hypothetical protein H5U00_10095, partial [Clostridia bacterium]|nr:hypothetical protein [Clostridia bacterium]
LSHASVVGREYGIPVVVNTFNASGELERASNRIETGQKIRVDGIERVVYILDK